MKLLHALFLSAIAGLGLGQGNPFMGSQRAMMVSPAMLMQQADFRNDLKLDKAQSKTIGELTKEFQKRLTDANKGLNGDPSSAMRVFGELQKSREETDAKILEILTPEQRTRFRQLQWQCLGHKALFEEDLQKLLGLSDEQIGKLKEHDAGESARLMDAMRAGSSAIKKAREESAKTAIGFLTPEQASAYKLALGKENKAAKRISEAMI